MAFKRGGSRFGWARAIATAALILAAALISRASLAQQVLFGPQPDLTTPSGFNVDADFPRLFAQPSLWQGGMRRIAAMLYHVRYIQYTPDAILRQQFAFLASQHIAIAMVMGVVEASGCGHGMEGMVFGPNVNLGVAQRLRALGADVTTLIADEPLTFGHYATQAGACRYAIPDLVGQFAREVAGVRAAYPAIRVIDNEAAPALQAFPDVAQWLDLLHQALGPEARLSLGLDVQWQLPWTSWAQQLVPFLAQHDTPYGLLVHGTGLDQTDAAWLAAAESYARAWEALVPVRPRTVVIQSWNANPTHVLPETDPTSMTSLITTYCAHTRWQLACNGLH